ncbi:MAG: hypothetical protein MUC56_07600 [Thermoanaerobaculales bacterium]|jgi:hypothetical protein|nr:hypothetical protein [Thermoanaerobaculales bacterium]
MANRPAEPKTPTLTILALVLSLGAVLTSYGWLAALNLVIPLFSAILWLGVLSLAAWGAGAALVTRIMPAIDDSLERVFFTLISGLGVLMVSSAVLAIGRVLRAPAVLAVLTLWACIGAIHLYRHRPDVATFERPRISSFALLVLAAGGLSLAAATTFSPFYDQWHYHLAFPEQWLRSGSVVVLERHAYSYLPSNMGLLYSFALAGPGGWAAQTTHWLMGVIAAGGAAVLAGRLSVHGHGRLLAGAVFLATPAVIQMGALAGADLGVAAFAMAAVLAVISVDSDAAVNRRRAAAGGVFAGLAVGCKYLALATVAVPLVVVAAFAAAAAAQPGRRLRGGAAASLAVAVGVLATSGPWFVRNLVVSGNPFYPYFDAAFDSSGGDSDVAAGVGEIGFGWEKVTAAATLGTFARRGHSGDLGPAFLWLSPLVMIWAWRGRRRPAVVASVAFVAGGALLWSVGPPLGRYLLPTLGVLAGCIGAAWEELGGVPRALFTGALVVVLISNCNPLRSEYLPGQLACFLGAASGEDYLAANVTQLEPVRAANEKLPEDAVVLMVGEPRVFGLDREVIVEDAFRSPLLVELAETSESPEEMARRLRLLGVTHVLVNRTEGRRIAAAAGRQQYLECSSPDSQRRLRGFFETHTSVVAAGEWWEISALSTFANDLDS